MAKFIAISGPSSSGKSTLINELSIRLNNPNVVILSDVFETVWTSLVKKGYFSESDEINKDSEFLCVYIQRVISKYKEIIEEYKSSNTLVILDSSWIDISIYSIVNMWCTNIIRELQENLLSQIANLCYSVNKVYLTVNDSSKQNFSKYHSPFKRYNIKYSRPLELQYYKLFSNFKHVEVLPSSDTDECATFIIEDLMNLGYLE